MRGEPKTGTRTLLVWLAITACLALGVWLTLPQCIEWIARNRLEAAGFEKVELSVERLSWGHLTLGNVVVADAGDDAWRLRAQEIEAGFRFSQLLRGKLDSVVVRGADLHLPGGTGSGQIDVGTLLGWLRQPWAALVPLNHLSIESLALQRPAESGPIRFDARVEANRSDSKIDARLGLRGTDGAFRGVVLQWTEEGTFELRVEPVDGRTHQPAELILNSPDGAQELHGTLTVDAQDLTHWLEPLIGSPIDARGQLSADFMARPHGRSKVALEAQATFADVSVPGTVIDTGHLSLNAVLSRSAEGLELRAQAGTTGEVGSLEIGDLRLTGTRLDWIGLLSVGSQGITVETEVGTRARIGHLSGVAFEAGELEVTTIGRIFSNDRGFTFRLAEASMIRGASLRIGDAHFRDPGIELLGSIARIGTEAQGTLERGTRATLSGMRWNELESDAIAVSLSGRYSLDGVTATALLEDQNRIRIDGLGSRDWGVEEVRASLAGRLVRTASKAAFTFDPAAEVSITGFEIAALSFDEAVVVPAGDRSLRWRSDDGATSLDAGAWSVTPSPIRIDEHRFVSDPVDMDLSWRGPPDSRVMASLVTPGADLHAYGYDFVLSNLQADVDVSPDGLSSALRFDRHGARFDADIRYGGEDGTGEVRFASEVFDLAAENVALSGFVDPWPFDFDLVSGMIRTAGTAWWDSGSEGLLGAQIDIGLDGAGGLYGPVVFSGLSADLALDVVPELRTRDSAPIKLDSVDFGIVMNELSAELELNPSRHGEALRYTLHDFGASLLGGRVESETVDYDPNRNSNAFRLGVRDVDLNEIVTLHGFDGLDATGRLDGTLPVAVDSGGVSVEGGEIHSLAPGGYIRYRSDIGDDDIGGAGSAAGIVMEVLRDFNYDVLEAEVDYATDGALRTAVHLQGTSDAFEGGRPVNLNVNLEQNLLALLKSLRLVGGLNEALDRRVREYYDAQQ